MPSWQARAVTLALKTFSKRRTLDGKIERTRRRIRRFADRDWPPPPGLRIRPAGSGGEAASPVPAEWVEPEGIEPSGVTPQRTILYLHGGAYVFCSPRTHRGITTYLARKTPARVLVPDYRLAPEHRFPAALEDALASYRWLRAQGIPASGIALAGDSAGGGLALAVMVALRDAGEALPDAAALMSPWTDLAGTGASLVTNTKSDAWLYGDTVALGATAYLGDAVPTNPLASPLYADLHGFPRMLLHASSSEVLLDDSVRLVERARAAGVDARLTVWPGLPHVWQGFPFIPEARQSLRELAAFLAKP